MIIGIGVDTVEIDRFKHWHSYLGKKLSRIFSQEEIDYCLAVSTKSAERFAARFAAKEAFFKAFCAAFPGTCVPFLTMCRYVSIRKDDNGRPTIMLEDTLALRLLRSYALKHCEGASFIQLRQGFVGQDEAESRVHISLSHTQSLATAFVIIEKL